jgi:hypothetical protein
MQFYAGRLLLLQANVLYLTHKQGSLRLAQQALTEFKKLGPDQTELSECGIGEAQTLIGMHKIINSEEYIMPYIKDRTMSIEDA